MTPSQLAERRLVVAAYEVAREHMNGEAPCARDIRDVLASQGIDMPESTIRDHAIAADLWTLERAEDVGDEPTRRLPAAR
jgi:hypothetical protein